MNRFVDSHCHLDRVDLKPFDNSFDRFMQATSDGGVEHMLCVSIDLESYPSMLALVEKYPQVSISVGVHPNEKERREPKAGELESLATHPKNVAIGETGLDYYRSETAQQWQQERFRHHIAAARNCNKPLIIHTRAAKADTLRIMREEGAADVGGVMHCYTEDWEMAQAALDMGFYISFSGIVSFRNAEELRQVAARVPQERLLIETDAPYLAPAPHRGKPNIPSYVSYVAECIAQVRDCSVEEIGEITRENFLRLFG
jgi:TatD DNase family protein